MCNFVLKCSGDDLNTQDSADIQNPNVQKIDYHRLQKDRTFEPNQGQYNLNQQTIDKADHFDRVHQLENRNKDQFGKIHFYM